MDPNEHEVLKTAVEILDGVPVGIFLTNAKGECTFVNSAWCSLTGIAPEESMGEGWARALHPDDHDRVTTEWQTAAAEARPFLSEFRFQKPDGSVAYVVGQARLSTIGGGEDIFIGSLTDITQKKRSDQARDELISVVSHELRGPLAAVHGALGYLLSGTVEVESERQQLLDMAVRNSKFLSHLVDDLLVFERLSSDKVRIELDNVDLHDLTSEAVAMSRQRSHAEEREIKLTSDTGVFVADRRRILQVLTNLIGNALKFSGSEEAVCVAAKRSAEETVFSVADQGRGIPPEMIERVFQPFEQVASEDHNRLGGAGLGLAISRAIVGRHGGRIWVESALGVGSTFFVSLPTEGPKENGAQEEIPEPHS